MTTTRTLSTLDAATTYAEHGLHVIQVWKSDNGRCRCPNPQCPSPGKHPVIDAWQIAATVDLTVLRDWFHADRFNIGVVCGPSGIIVVDVDPRNGGDDTLAALIAECGPLPDSVAADSGGGGAHLLFRRPAGDLVGKLGKGVDLLRDGRQFLVEPSIHPSGNAYRWRAGRAPDEIHIADLPDAWIERCRRRVTQHTAPGPREAPQTDRERRARAYVERMPGGVEGDNGSTVTFNTVCCVMFGFDLDEATTLAIITDVHNPKCDPPWSERELRHKVSSAALTCKRERGYLLIDRQRVTDTQQAAAATQPQAEHSESVDWHTRLIAGDKGKPRRGYHNVAVFVRYFPDYAGRWSMNLMSDEPYFDNAPVPPSKIHDIRAHIDRRIGFTPSPSDIEAAIGAAGLARPFHPIRQYLRSVDWDGVPRLSGAAQTYLSSGDPLHALMVRRWMIGAVARAMRPGCKLDTALMLIGDQGIGKSTFFAVLGGAWHADTFLDLNSKDCFSQLHAAWIYELSELENVVTGSRESRLKAFVTSTHDTYRPPYGRTSMTRPRSVVLCGTSNRRQLLTDDTGSRRFWIVPVGATIPRQLLEANRDQLWAEALAAYESGEPWWLDQDHEELRDAANADYYEDDAWVDYIRQWLPPMTEELMVSDILTMALKIEQGRQTKADQQRAGRALRQLGFTRDRRLCNGVRQWVWVRDQDHLARVGPELIQS